MPFVVLLGQTTKSVSRMKFSVLVLLLMIAMSSGHPVGSDQTELLARTLTKLQPQDPSSTSHTEGPL